MCVWVQKTLNVFCIAEICPSKTNKTKTENQNLRTLKVWNWDIFGLTATMSLKTITCSVQKCHPLHWLDFRSNIRRREQTFCAVGFLCDIKYDSIRFYFILFSLFIFTSFYLLDLQFFLFKFFSVCLCISWMIFNRKQKVNDLNKKTGNGNRLQIYIYLKKNSLGFIVFGSDWTEKRFFLFFLSSSPVYLPLLLHLNSI